MFIPCNYQLSRRKYMYRQEYLAEQQVLSGF